MKVEPPADMRGLAKLMRGMFIALLDEGFTEKQALIILGQLVNRQTGGDNG